jgi:hypothetical protein
MSRKSSAQEQLARERLKAIQEARRQQKADEARQRREEKEQRKREREPGLYGYGI